MPANLPAEARAKWKRVSEARTIQEKIKALEDFLSSVPRHKGTEKLVSQVRRQIASLRRELLESKRRKIHKGERFFIEKEGDVQVVLLGFTNSGKSSFLRSVSNANPSISPTPYTTRIPIPGTSKINDIVFQFIEAPALSDKELEWTSKVLALARNADAIMLMIDLSWDPLYQLKTLLKNLSEANISLSKSFSKIKLEKRREGGIAIIGRIKDGSENDVRKMLIDFGYTSCTLRINGEASLSEIERAIISRKTYKPTIIFLNKRDLYWDEKITKFFLRELGYEAIFFSGSCIKKDFDLNVIGETLRRELNLVRIYTKPPGREVIKKPLVVKNGVKVIDVAKLIHTRLYKNFRYARVWSKRFTFNPQRVGKNFVLQDRDIVEITA